MSKENRKGWILSLYLFILFVCYTLLLRTVDVKPVGPEGSKVGFATINMAIFNMTGFNDICYTISKYLGYVAFLVIALFAFMGVYQLVKRKSFAKVDKDLYVLAGFYVLVGAVYVLFEKLIINYRPLIMDPQEGLEASYPSSHTVLALCVFATAAINFARKVKEKRLRNVLVIGSMILMIVMVVTRFLAGCHWTTDIVGGIILSGFLVTIFNNTIAMINKRN